MLINVVSYWLIGLSLGYWLTFGAGHGAAGMWIGMIAGLVTGATLLTLRFFALSRKFLSPSVVPVP
jgi:MATE family multidrug resistance protein